VKSNLETMASVLWDTKADMPASNCRPACGFSAPIAEGDQESTNEDEHVAEPRVERFDGIRCEVGVHPLSRRPAGGGRHDASEPIDQHRCALIRGEHDWPTRFDRFHAGGEALQGCGAIASEPRVVCDDDEYRRPITREGARLRCNQRFP